MDSSPFSQHSIHLGLSQAATDSNSLPLYLSSPLEPFSLSLGIRSANIAFPAGRPLSVSQDAPYCLLVPFICRLDTAEPTTSFPPSQIFLSPLKKRVQVPLAVEVKRSPSSRRHIHRKAQLMVPVLVVVCLHFAGIHVSGRKDHLLQQTSLSETSKEPHASPVLVILLPFFIPFACGVFVGASPPVLIHSCLSTLFLFAILLLFLSRKKLPNQPRSPSPDSDAPLSHHFRKEESVFSSEYTAVMPEQQRREQEEQQQNPLSSMMIMFAIFMLMRNFMGGLSKPAQQESPASIIANYNQSLKTPEPENTVDMSNPISGMLGLMKGMMPVKMGDKDITYIPSLKEGDLCVRF
jgi:singapore isolate B (sub-type 7) whole genome shotgun sequence assembly, scaffold_0